MGLYGQRIETRASILLHAHDHTPESIPKATTSNEARKLDTSRLSLKGISNPLAECWRNVTSGEVSVRLLLDPVPQGYSNNVRVKKHRGQPERQLHLTKRFDLNVKRLVRGYSRNMNANILFRSAIEIAKVRDVDFKGALNFLKVVECK